MAWGSCGWPDNRMRAGVVGIVVVGNDVLALRDNVVP
jgi:hypothetical protein